MVAIGDRVRRLCDAPGLRGAAGLGTRERYPPYNRMNSSRNRVEQELLFSSDSNALLMHKIRSLPKIDLHRHLTGSIDADMAARIGAKYEIPLPTYLSSELDSILFGRRQAATLEEYFTPWETLNRLFSSRGATREIILEVIRKAADDNVIYVELRTGPHGFLGNGTYPFEEFLEIVASATSEAEAKFGTKARFIMGIPRHVFGRIPVDKRNRMCAQIISMLQPYRNECFVGVDLNGIETTAAMEDFAYCFQVAREQGFHVTAHAGECGPAANVAYAVNVLKASRIGHGIAAAADPRVITDLLQKHCALEICPTSNEFLGVVHGVGQLPLGVLQAQGVPFVICTDNPARCKTSLSEELFKVSKAFSLSDSDLLHLTETALAFCFADFSTKEVLRARIDHFPAALSAEA
jgi:adenosine deaminase